MEPPKSGWCVHSQVLAAEGLVTQRVHGGAMGIPCGRVPYACRRNPIAVFRFNTRICPSISGAKVVGCALVSLSQTAFWFQRAKRPPALGPWSLAFNKLGSSPGMSSKRLGCHGFDAFCSSRKKSAFVLPARYASNLCLTHRGHSSVVLRNCAG